MTVPAALAILALLAPNAAGERAVPRGWFVRLGADAWSYSATGPEQAQPARSRPATFLHLGDDGTAILLSATLSEDTTSRAGKPALADGDGFSVWSGTWRRSSPEAIEIELGFRLSSLGDPPEDRTISVTLHGRHLLAADGPLVPLGYAYPGEFAPLRKQLFEWCCAVPGRDRACRTVRR